jgi:hypothetical protein
MLKRGSLWLIVHFGPGNIMHAVIALADQSADVVNPNICAIWQFLCAPWNKPTCRRRLPRKSADTDRQKDS